MFTDGGRCDLPLPDLPSADPADGSLAVDAEGMRGEGAARAAPSAIRTTCPYCGVGCGVLATPDGKGGAAIRGDPEHPANAGRLCSKGSALGETLGLETRLLHPIVDGAHTSWAHALDQVARRLAAVRAAHGPEAIAFYLSGQLLTEDYYVANKLAKGFIGTPHVDTNSRLCMASSVAGHRRAFGADVVPQCYDDLELADLVVLAGSNAAWCHPILYQRIQTARGERGMRVVNIDPRRTATSEGVDLQLSLKPGSDGVLWSGLLVWLAEHRAIDTEFINAHTQGFFAALWGARAIAPTIGAVAAATGLDERDIERFYDWFASTSRVVSCYSQGVNQSAQGTDKVNAILNCHLATGRIGKPGSGPLSLTGQPNAMGGREVGGLANMLAAHMGFSADERDRVRRFWNAPNLVAGEGLKAVDMFEAVADGRIKALWIMGTNPAVSLPRADAMRAALSRLELLVVSDNVASNDTVARAHIALPAAAWGEKDGTVTNSERCVSRQRAFLPPPGRARPDWWMLSQVARRLGHGNAFAYRSAADIFDEHARLSGFENGGSRAFDISGRAGLGREAFDALAPFQWPLRAGEAPTERLFGDGRFFTGDGKARFVAIAEPRLSATVSKAWPFVLNTGRVRDQWHTMTRTGLSPRLSSHIAEPFAEIHPDDAAARGAGAGGAGARDDPVRRRQRAGAGQPRTAAGHAVRADPLVGREQLVRAHRRAGAAGHRPLFGPTRIQGDAGAYRPARRQPLRPRALAPAVEPCRPRLLDGGAGHLRPHPALRPRRAGRRLARLAARHAARGRHAHLRRCRGGLLSRRRAARRTARGHDPGRRDAHAARARMAQVAVRAADDPSCRAPRLAGRPAGRGGRRRRTDRVRLLPGRRHPHRRGGRRGLPHGREDRRAPRRRHQLRQLRARDPPPDRGLGARPGAGRANPGGRA